MDERLQIQHAFDSGKAPADEKFHLWVNLIFEHFNLDGSVVIRLVEADESQSLNHQYRHKDYATNVLSFPFEAPEFTEDEHLGDIVICVSVVNREAQEQHKPLESHWAHMVIHGLLHLLGYDHEEEVAAELMESKEIELLKQLGIDNPYETDN
jgi:probable rRNA maturation factor